MDLGARGAWAALLLGALQVLALAGAAEQPEYTVPLHNSSGNLSETVPSSNTSKSSNTSSSTVKPLTTISVVSINVTAVTRKSTSKMATPGVSTSTTPTTSKSTPKGTSISHNISHMSTPTMTTTHSSSVTLLTTTVHSKEYRGSKFDTGSFVGGIVLTLGVLSILYIGCKMYYSRRGIRYRTIDEHDAII